MSGSAMKLAATQAPWWRCGTVGVLVIAGVNLTLVQFVAMREFAALVGSSELVVLLVLTGYFLGLSLGYLVSDRLTRRALGWLGAATVVLHATLPFSARWATGWLTYHNFGEAVVPLVFGLVLFGIAPFYALFLPRLIDAEAGQDGEPALARCYAAEVAGSLLGLSIIAVVTPANMGGLLALHLVGVLALLALFLQSRGAWLVLIVVLPVGYMLGWADLDRKSLEYYYRYARDLKGAEIVASEFSPYQRIDLVQSERDGAPVTSLYLNGNLLYGSRSLHVHNLMVALAPVVMSPARAPRALVVAGGSLDNARYLAPRTGRLEVVEIDEAVVRMTRRYIQEPRGPLPTNWQLTIDDGKHFLGAWTGEAFDTIAVDVPVPTHLQTAMLHSERFFALARSRLKPDGVFSISLAARLQPAHLEKSRVPSWLANRTAAGLRRVFKHVRVVRAGGRDFAWASDAPLPGGRDEVQARIDGFLDTLPDGRLAFGRPKISIMADAAVAEATEGFAPIGEADMQIVLRLAWRKLESRFFDATP